MMNVNCILVQILLDPSLVLVWFLQGRIKTRRTFSIYYHPQI